MQLLNGALYCACFAYVLRYNLHMFQLNGYKNGEQCAWLKKNAKKQAILLLLAVALFLNLMGSGVWMLLPNAIAVAATFSYYRFLKKINNKKVLVYTARAKRIIACDVIFSACAVLLGMGIFGINCAVMVIFATILQPLSVMGANIINAPLEKGIREYYIRDAKRILEDNKDLIVIGVTGSYGKTSVKFYLEALLRDRFNVLATPESYNTPMGVVKTIRGSLKPAHEIFICEMGARRTGEIKELCDIVHPSHGIITAIGPQHLETFLSIDNIVNTKFELADALPDNGMLFLNGDNALIRGKAGQYASPIFYGMGDGNGYRVADVELSQSGTRFAVIAPDGEKCGFQTRLIGEHNVINILGAIAVANRLGIPLKDLRVPVRRISPVAHRMQILERGDITIIDDAFNSNPEGSRSAVETLGMFDGIRILITPGMVELGEMEEELNYQFGGYAAGCCDYIYLVGKKRTEPIRKGVLAGGFEPARCMAFDTLQDAMNQAVALKEAEHKYVLLENDLPDNY